MKENLSWWISEANRHNGRTMSIPHWEGHDRSKMGWGACTQGVSTGGPWTTVPHQPPATVCSISGPPDVCSVQEGHPYSSPPRPGVSNLNKMGKLHSCREAVQTVHGSMEMVSLEERDHSCRTPSREGEHSGRLGVPSCLRLQRLEVGHRGVQCLRREVRSLLSCIPDEKPAADLL